MSRPATLDRTLAIIAGCLVLYGLLVLFSAGQTDVPTRAIGVWQRQIVWTGLGVVVAFAAYRVSPRLLEWLAPAAYGFGILLLVIVLAVGTGAGTAESSHSWLAIGGVRIGQPSEFAKLATVLMLARHLAGLREAPRSLRDLLVPGLIVGVPFLLVLKQPDLGSALVFVGIFFAMMFWAGTRLLLLLMVASPGISLLLAFSSAVWSAWMVALFAVFVLFRPFVLDGVLVYAANAVMGAIAMPMWNRLAPYQQNRLRTFLNPELDPLRSGYHALQSKTAIGSGGWLGQGYTLGPQKRLAFLPEQATDFVFAVVGEELGFVGVLIALVLFCLLFLTLVRIARRAGDTYASLMVFGILGLLFTHVFENVGMTVNVMPITGIPLPFFSYGGSFFLICCVCLGLAFRVAADSRQSSYIEF